MSDLQSLPNIGKESAKMLKQVGICSAEQLKTIGTEQAFLRLRAIDPGACLSLLCALEGAIQGIRWHSISPERKEELKHFIKMIK